MVLGKREADGRCLIFDVILTPDAEESQEDIKKAMTTQPEKRSLRDLINTKYSPDMNYVTWLELFVETVIISLALFFLGREITYYRH